MSVMEILPQRDTEALEEKPFMLQDYKDRHCYVSGNGQLVFDEHPTDDVHLQASSTRTEQPLYDCRVYLRDLIPKEWIGKRGTLRVSRMRTSHKTVVALTFFVDEPPNIYDRL